MRTTGHVIFIVLAYLGVMMRGTEAFVSQARTGTATRNAVLHHEIRFCGESSGGDGFGEVILQLRGGKTVGSKKSSSSSKASSSSSSKATGKAKGVKKSTASSSKDKLKKKKDKPRKPTFMTTLKAFFHSLVNPHFALKLEAKKANQVHTVHGTASTTKA